MGFAENKWQTQIQMQKLFKKKKNVLLKLWNHHEDKGK